MQALHQLVITTLFLLIMVYGLSLMVFRGQTNVFVMRMLGSLVRLIWVTLASILRGVFNAVAQGIESLSRRGR